MSMYDKNHYNKQKKKKEKKRNINIWVKKKKKKKDSGIVYPERIIASTSDNFQSFL